MRKLISFFCVLNLASLPVATTVACDNSNQKTSKVWVVTDGGTVNDHSFNQSALEGADDFAQNGFNRKASFIETKNTSGGSDPSADDFKQAYQVALNSGAEYIAIAGFKHAATAGWLNHQAQNYANFKGIVFLDSAAEAVKNEDGGYSKIAGTTFDSQNSGFYAGLAVGIYLNAFKKQGDVNGDGKLSAATFGGFDFAGSVTNYMWGFLGGLKTFNKIVDPANKDLQLVKPSLYNIENYMKIITGQDQTLEKIELAQTTPPAVGTNGKDDSTWFTSSFSKGDGVTLAKSLASKADVIFPVAGPQTLDVLENTKSLVVGVDVDQAKLYEKYQNRFITSALKNIRKAAFEILNMIRNNPTYALGKTWGTSDDTPYHKDWAGISIINATPLNFAARLMEDFKSKKLKFNLNIVNY
ncbi:BMP family ABC transporter substrate-binding protein [Spiroplasma sp. DGKH1]|uniref:BMP family ABC transporter substrate-binding protein n=1 Tax=Spiroplasma sp. DGKH1 TaxID=3050074 RepID=UPI0034C6D0F3